MDAQNGGWLGLSSPAKEAEDFAPAAPGWVGLASV